MPGPYGETCDWTSECRSSDVAFEYDGEEWHLLTEEQREHDEDRRGYLRDEQGWLIQPVTKANLWGPQRDIESILVSRIREARRRFR